MNFNFIVSSQLNYETYALESILAGSDDHDIVVPHARAAFVYANSKTLAFRLAQHGVFYSADADCVGITNKIEWRLNKTWLELVAASGTPLFVCADPKAMTPEIEADITAAFKTVCEDGAVEPIDWFENITPNRWLSSGNIAEYFQVLF